MRPSRSRSFLSLPFLILSAEKEKNDYEAALLMC